jgi:hypothetical protein
MTAGHVAFAVGGWACAIVLTVATRKRVIDFGSAMPAVVVALIIAIWNTALVAGLA